MDVEPTVTLTRRRAAIDRHSVLRANTRPLVGGVRLARFSGQYTDADRLARVFRSAWRRIPRTAKLVILRNARRGGPLGTGSLRALGALLLEGMPSLDRSAGDEVGAYYPASVKMQLRADALAALPDDLLEVLIAHELGHAAYPDAEREQERDADPRWTAEEDEVRALVEWWGFDEWALTEWLAAHRPVLARLPAPA